MVALPVADHIRDQQHLRSLIAKTEEPMRVQLIAARDLAFGQLLAVKRKTPLFVLTLGTARVFHLPGELFVEYQLAVQSRVSGSFVAVAAYGDYGPGYIGTRVAYAQGGYETGPVSRTSPDVEDVLMAAIRELPEVK